MIAGLESEFFVNSILFLENKPLSHHFIGGPIQTEGMLRSAAEKVSPAKKTDRGLPMIAGMPDEDKELFIEIVSCRDLLAADKSGTSDPYVKISLGKKELHRTKHVLKTLNPSFTEKFNNFYVLDCSTKEDLFTNGGLTFKVRDWDRGIGGDDDLGSAFVPADTLYNYFEDTKEFKIDPPKGKADEAGFITIRCRAATLGDRENLKKAKSPMGAILKDSFSYDQDSKVNEVFFFLILNCIVIAIQLIIECMSACLPAG